MQLTGKRMGMPPERCAFQTALQTASIKQTWVHQWQWGVPKKIGFVLFLQDGNSGYGKKEKK
jgi:hypothetical protein